MKIERETIFRLDHMQRLEKGITEKLVKHCKADFMENTLELERRQINLSSLLAKRIPRGQILAMKSLRDGSADTSKIVER